MKDSLLQAYRLVTLEKHEPGLFGELCAIFDSEDFAKEFCYENELYRILGYKTPSEIKPKHMSYEDFWRSVVINKCDCIRVTRFTNTLGGYWYAFKGTLWFKGQDCMYPQPYVEPLLEEPLLEAHIDIPSGASDL